MSAVVAFPRTNRRARYGDGTIVEQPDGRFRVQVSAGRDPQTGKRIRLGGYANTKDDAEKLKHRLIGKMLADERSQARPAPRPATSWTVGSWLDEWRTRTTDNGNSQAFRQNKGDHIKDHLGSIPLEDLRRTDVRTLVNITLKKKHCGMRALAPQTRDHVLDTLRAALAEAMNDDEVGLLRNVARGVSVTDYDAAAFDPRILTDGEYKRFLVAAARWDRVRKARAGSKRHVVPMEGAFVLLAERGIREGELLGLQRKHVDLKAGTIQILQQLQPIRGGGPTKKHKRRNGLNLHIVKTKSKASRRKIRLTERCKVALREHLTRLDALERKLGPTWNPKGMLFPTVLGIPMHPATLVHEFFHPICALAHITPRSQRHPDGLRVHDLRHNSATRLLKKSKGDIDLVRRVHGWSSLAMVQRYVHLLPIDEEMELPVAG